MNCELKKTAVIGGGAAGFFLAINLKERCPQMQVSILERSQRVLSKVAVSGGGRCNCTNTFQDVTDLQQVYPRGHRLLRRLFGAFGPADAYQWFERRGVPLTVQPDGCVFPRSQDAQTIVRLFTTEARRLGISVETGRAITSLSELDGCDFVAVTTGGMPAAAHAAASLLPPSIPVVAPVPSLFTFSIADERLRQLMGTVVEHASAAIAGTKMRAEGPLLITHWGMSGPCILRLSSHAARLLSEGGYRAPLTVNWTGTDETAVRTELSALMQRHAQRQLSTVRPFSLQQRLWQYLAEKSIGSGRAHAPWGSLNQKEVNRLVAVLTSDRYDIVGRAPFKDEFVTCGGVALTAVHPQTLECKTVPGLFFAGEVLDIDGITGGFNFQAAWTTAMTVATAIAQRAHGEGKWSVREGKSAVL